jgi:hypothetical protein
MPALFHRQDAALKFLSFFYLQKFTFHARKYSCIHNGK